MSVGFDDHFTLTQREFWGGHSRTLIHRPSEVIVATLKVFTIVLLAPIHENNRIFFVDPCSANEHVLLELLQEQEMHVKGYTNTCRHSWLHLQST